MRLVNMKLCVRACACVCLCTCPCVCEQYHTVPYDLGFFLSLSILGVWQLSLVTQKGVWAELTYFHRWETHRLIHAHAHACAHTHWQRETHISSGCCHLAQISTGSASLCCFWIRCFWILHLIHVLHVAYTVLFYPASVVKTIWLRIKAYTWWWKQLYTLPYAVAFISVIHITY